MLSPAGVGHVIEHNSLGVIWWVIGTMYIHWTNGSRKMPIILVCMIQANMVNYLYFCMRVEFRLYIVN